MISNYGFSLQNYAAGTRAEKSNISPPPSSTALNILKSKPGLSPATTVELSEKAKSLVEQNKAASEASNNLSDTKTFSIRLSSNNPSGSYSSLIPISFFDSLMPPGSKDKTDEKWEAGAPHGDPTKSDARFIRDIGLSNDRMDMSGFPPEVGQALNNAIRTGAIKIQKASEVAGLNFKSQQIFTPNPMNGMGYNAAISTTQNPTGDVQKAIASGRALAMWTADRGDVYLSW